MAPTTPVDGEGDDSAAALPPASYAVRRSSQSRRMSAGILPELSSIPQRRMSERMSIDESEIMTAPQASRRMSAARQRPRLSSAVPDRRASASQSFEGSHADAFSSLGENIYY